MLDTIQDVLYEFFHSTIAKIAIVILAVPLVFFGFRKISVLSEIMACEKLGGTYKDGICTVRDDVEEYAKNVIIVTGNTANSPKPQISKENDSEIYDYIKNSILKYGSINLKTISAATDKSSKTIKVEGEVNSVSKQEEKINNTIDSINETIGKAPKSDGATYFEAIVKAGRAASSYKNSDESIVLVFGSGLSDGGVLNFAEGNLLSKKSTDIITAMNNAEQLEGEYLDGVNIKWIGIGQTMRPQEELSPGDIDKLQSIYSMALSKLGANVEFFDEIIESDTIENNKYTVKTTPIKEVELESDDFDEKTLSFVEKGVQFLNQKQASDVLSKVIEKAKANPTKKLIITGYMAAGSCSSSRPNDPGLSGGRAETVKKYLVDNGVTNRIEVVDGGVFDPEVSECVNGKWKADRAAYRRRVVIDYK